MTRPIKRKRPRRQLSSSDENVNPSPARVCYYSTSPERSPPKRKCLSSSSSHSPKESSAETRLDRMEDMMQRLFEMMSSNKENENEPEISSWRAPSPLLVSPSENPPKEMVENWDIFSPSTKESEPAIPRANPILEEQGLKCQRLGETTWNKIRYSEAQKKLHASPVFNCLRVNATLQQYSYPSQIKDLLGKCDSAFGTITHGLLAQRLKLQEALKKVADQHPDAADTLKKALMAENEFRSLSDDLLQYSCGKRAEIIEYRRKLYEPKNKYYRSFLEEIPPTGTHLWDEEKLQLAIKTHGISKIAPAPRRPVLDYTGKNNKWKQPRDSNNTKKSFQGVKKFKRPEFKPRPQTQRPQTSKDQKHDSFKERSAAWLRHNPPDESNLFQVSRHLAILLLLSSGRRVHDLTLLRIDSGFIVQSENEVIFWPQYGSKTDKTKYIQSGWKLIKNKEQLWNIVYWIKLYIELSHQRRHPDGKIIPSLFVTTRGKTGPASRSVIAGWVRTALLSAGIEAGAGSTRSAVATFRFNNCVPLDELLKKGNWQGPDNFFKHYYKEIDKSPPCDDSNDKIMITESFVPL
ncbi:putative reverse transcriptase-7 [Operophtera brumata]|uniref:Putative reverse transcriptase-7 n=1 Tax=Operophtera brumata TaxID=104452 RepID=A0A0L7KT19_OPEBR|nr:putative reverse transcriptase-7 [Operophtera brumata]